MNSVVRQLRAHGRWLAYLFRHGGGWTWASLGVIALEAVAAGLSPWVLGHLVTALIGSNRHDAIVWLVWLIVLSLVGAVLGKATTDTPATSRLLVTLHEDFAEVASARLRLGRGERRERLQALYSDITAWQVQAAVGNELTVVYFRLSALTSFVVVATWNPWCAIVVAVLFLAFSELGTAWLVTMQAQSARDQDVAAYWHGLVAGSGRREARLFGLAGEFIARFQRSWLTFEKVTTAAFRRKARPVYLVAVLVVLALAGTLAWLGHDAWTGAIAVGMVVTVVGSLVNFSGFGMTGDAALSAAYCQGVVERLSELRALAEPDAVEGVDGVPSDKPEPAPVEIEGVRFCYPGSQRAAVDGVSLTLTPGSTTAIVGMNGSGKSTLMRLIAGIAEPGEGTIAVAGDTTTRMRHVSAVFQESAHFPLDVRDNVGLGLSGVEEASKSAGVESSVLNRAAEVGDDPGLSGGQWQRVALARCLLRAKRRGGVVLLDEPTAALDPLQEKALFDDFRTLTHGLTAVLVTHRLGSVIDVDRIVVMDAGRLVAEGTHAELMAAGGLYAELFELQRKALLEPAAAIEGGADHE